MTGREVIIKAADECSISSEQAARLVVALQGYGYVCVPRIPTEYMLEEGWAPAHEEDARDTWDHMIRAVESE